MGKEKQDRFDYKNKEIDDVDIYDVEEFRLEVMDDDKVWTRCYKKNGEMIDFNFFIDGKKIKIMIEKYKEEK